MPVARMRMRQWLERQIESASISGLGWMDQEKTMFSIPWKHAARHGWEINTDACLFKQWAIHTGKYVEGQTSDPKTWKANFRCAMNSLPDIEEVKNKSINKGHQAVRVYRMLPCSPKSREKRSKARETKQRKKRAAVKAEEDSDYSDTHSPRNADYESTSTQENRVDSTVMTEEFPLMLPSEVPDCSLSIEVEASNYLDSYLRFEISPEHSPEYQSIIEICQKLEEEQDIFSSVDCSSFLSNEACTSPESSWSDTSAADDLDNIPQYLTLGSSFLNSTEDSWTPFLQP